MAGIGLSGEFKIGFDEESQRFVVKVKAQAALGLGIGGQLDIVVSIGAMWDFVTFVHSELARHDFNYLDIFETADNPDDESDIDVFELFSALSWKLLTQGKPLSAAAALGVGALADQIIDALNDYRGNTTRASPIPDPRNQGAYSL